jgi:RNA polymerase sigma factor (TIGR02999 family)
MEEKLTNEQVAALSVEVYEELRAIAARQFRREREGHTLQPTALVHEAYVRLGKQQNLQIHGRTHFLNIAARQIRQILVDHARSRGRQKRGGDRQRVTLVTDLADPNGSVDLLALDDALNALDEFSPEGRRIVELKFFGGLTEAEIAESLGLSERTVRRRWHFARSWLYEELNG